MFSRLRLPHSAALERPPEQVQDLGQPPVGMKSRRQAKIGGHFGHGELILEAELDEQLVRRCEGPQCVLERPVDLRNADCIVNTHPALVNQLVKIDLGADQVDQAPTDCLILRPSCGIVRVVR